MKDFAIGCVIAYCITGVYSLGTLVNDVHSINKKIEKFIIARELSNERND